MKKLLFIFICILTLSLLFGCGEKLQLEEDSRTILTFWVGSKRISRTLTTAETETVLEILNGVRPLSLPIEDRTCGFSKDVSLTIDGNVFAMAQDECCMLQNMKTMEVIVLSQEKYGQLVEIFEHYGGYLPCMVTEPTEP